MWVPRFVQQSRSNAQLADGLPQGVLSTQVLDNGLIRRCCCHVFSFNMRFAIISLNSQTYQAKTKNKVSKNQRFKFIAKPKILLLNEAEGLNIKVIRIMQSHLIINELIDECLMINASLINNNSLYCLKSFTQEIYQNKADAFLSYTHMHTCTQTISSL